MGGIELKKYWLYLKYILEHKKNVFKTCWKRGLYIHAFTHDLSTFYPSEFFPYANWFNGKYGVNFKKFLCYGSNVKHNKSKQKFEEAWKKHYSRNKHHWNYWLESNSNNHIFSVISLFNVIEQGGKKEAKNMPHKYIMQMICDWEAMSLKFGDSAQEYYLKNYDKIKLHRKTRALLEEELGLFPFLYDCPESGCTYMTLEELFKLNK